MASIEYLSRAGDRLDIYTNALLSAYELGVPLSPIEQHDLVVALYKLELACTEIRNGVPCVQDRGDLRKLMHPTTKI